MNEKQEFDNWLLTLSAAGVFTGFLPVTAVCASLWAFRKATEPTSRAIRATGNGIGATVKKAKKLILEKREPEVVPITKKQLAAEAAEEYDEACDVIDAMPLDEPEKASMRICAKRLLIEQMWELLK